MLRKKTTKTETRTVDICGRAVECHITYSSRRSMQIRISRSGILKVSVPLKMPQARMMEFIAQRAQWIDNHLKAQRDHTQITVQKHFAEGDELIFLGHSRRIKWVKALAAEVELSSDELLVKMPANSAPRLNRMVAAWLKQATADVFATRLQHCLKATSAIGISSALPVTFRRMRSRWGSCSQGNSIMLNSDIIHLAPEYIDYVILHELCHFREKNHSPAYYALLQTVCPEYKKLRGELNRFVFHHPRS